MSLFKGLSARQWMTAITQMNTLLREDTEKPVQIGNCVCEQHTCCDGTAVQRNLQMPQSAACAVFNATVPAQRKARSASFHKKQDHSQCTAQLTAELRASAGTQGPSRLQFQVSLCHNHRCSKVVAPVESHHDKRDKQAVQAQRVDCTKSDSHAHWTDRQGRN